MGKRREGPKGCLFYRHSLELLGELEDGEAGRAAKAAASYFLSGEMPEGLAGKEELVCKVMCSDVDDSLDRYQEACARNRANRNSRRTGFSPMAEYSVLMDEEED